MRLVLLVLLGVGLTGTAWADEESDDLAAGAVEAYVEAFLTIDYEAAQDVLCATDLETLDRATFEQALETVAPLHYTADLSDLTYDGLELSEALVEVEVSGEIQVEIESQSQPVMIEPHDLKLDSLWSVYEDESWKACSQVPSELIDDLGPDVIARIFTDGAFRGNYEQAHNLICEAQVDSLSEAEFDQIFGQMAEEGTRLNFHDTVFEITEQTDKSAVVTLTGDIEMTVGGRPQPITVSAASIGLQPVHLRYEEGWRICSAEPVES